jgi:hypothetical protein
MRKHRAEITAHRAGAYDGYSRPFIALRHTYLLTALTIRSVSALSNAIHSRRVTRRSASGDTPQDYPRQIARIDNRLDCR